MNKDMTNLLIFMALCFVGYLIFRSLPFKEGMNTVVASSSTTSGVGGDAAAYAATIKSHAVKHQDELHIDKYRSDYENAVLNLDDLVDHMMLKESLNVNHADPMSSLEKIAKLNGVKSGLNNVMKFMDSK
jgi:hypothetical protein